MRVLKNVSNVRVEKNVNGKVYTIKPKGSLTIKDSQENEIATNLLTTYGFLKDITPVKTYPAPKAAEVKKVVVKAKSKPGRKGVRRK